MADFIKNFKTTFSIRAYRAPFKTMISIDHFLISSLNRGVIKICLRTVKDNKDFRQLSPNKYWRGCIIYQHFLGFKVYFHKNRYDEFDTVSIAFSPHKMANNGLHNANQISFYKLTNNVLLVLQKLGLKRNYCNEFHICSIELGVNFEVNRDPYFILNSAIMAGTYFFKETEYRHYRIANNPKNKYLKYKLYIKAEQRITSTQRTFAELGYCSNKTMRFEIKIERPEKQSFFNFSNLENLFHHQTEAIFKRYIREKFESIFFFSTATLNRNDMITEPYKRFYFKSEDKNYWHSLESDKRWQRKKFYERIPKSFDIKKELQEIFPIK